MRIDPKLVSFLKGKRVAYVCPGQHLIGKRWGEIIDSYDVVVRVNQKFSLKDKEKLDYGSRTDLIFGAFSRRCIYECNKNISFFLKNQSLKGIVVTQLHENSTLEFKKLVENTAHIPFMVFSREDILNVYKKVGTNCTSGIVGLDILIECQPREVYIFGMNFYNFGKYGNVYYSSYYDSITEGNKESRQHARNKNRAVSPQNTRWDIVNLHKQILFLKDIIRNNEKVKVDPFISENLESYDKKVVGVLDLRLSGNKRIEDSNISIFKQIRVFDNYFMLRDDKDFKDLESSLGSEDFLVYIRGGSYIFSSFDIKNFTNFLVAYNLSLLVSCEKECAPTLDFTERISPTKIDYNLKYTKKMLKHMKKEKIINAFILGGKKFIIQEIVSSKDTSHDYKEDIFSDFYILDYCTSDGMYIPLQRALKEDLSNEKRY